MKDVGICWSQSSPSTFFGEYKNLLPLPGIKPRLFFRPAHRINDGVFSTYRLGDFKSFEDQDNLKKLILCLTEETFHINIKSDNKCVSGNIWCMRIIINASVDFEVLN
jgi:hypothetical protein